ncbi:MAG: short-chain dehydrogenase, partial [uncultured bacterium]
MNKVDKINESIALLEELATNSELLAELSPKQHLALMKVAGQLSRPDRLEIIKRQRANYKNKREKVVLKERQARASTGIRQARLDAVFQAPPMLAPGTVHPPAHEMSKP